MPQVRKANPCLESVFYVFNVLLGITGCVLFIVAIVGSEGKSMQGNQIGVAILYVMAVAFMLLSFLGIFGAHKENAVALEVFLVLMMVGAVFLFVRGIQFSNLQYQMRQDDTVKTAGDDAFRAALGITFGFSAVAVLGVILSMVLLGQIGFCRNPAYTPV